MQQTKPSVTLAVLAIAGVAYALLQSLVSPALSTIQHELGASESGVAWVLTGYLLSAAISTPILGRLGDIVGKRRVLIGVLIGLAAGTLLAAVASSLSVLILARVIQGVGGGVFPLAFGIIRDEFPREKISGSIGIMSALLGLGGGLGVVFAGLIVDNMTYHWLFWFPLIAILGSLVATILLIPESPDRAPGKINWTGAVLMSVGLAAVLLAISEAHTWGWGSAKTLGLAAAGLAVLGIWVKNELRADEPLVDMRMMAVRGVWTTNLVAVMLGAGMFTSFILIPQLVQLPGEGTGIGFGASVTGAGLFLLPNALVMLVVGAAAGGIERRFGSKLPVLAGVLFSFLGFLLLLVAHDDKLPVYAASALLGIGIGLAFAAMANLVVQAVPPHQTGVATGMNTVARSVGGAFGGQLAATFLAGSVLATTGLPQASGFNEAFVASLIALAIAFVAALLIPGRPRAVAAGARSAASAPAVAATDAA
jgi:EmrB/QacA subfamily drug resistance transporter